MTYKEHVIDVFIEHHNCMGLDLEEIEELMDGLPFQQLEKWLKQCGYNLEEMYLEVRING